MDVRDLFPPELTDQEKAAGYQVAEIENPLGHFQGHDRKIKAVIINLGPSERVVKVVGGGGRIGYVYQIYGVYQDLNNDRPDWKPAGYLVPDPEKAVIHAREWIRHGFDFKIRPVIPS